MLQILHKGIQASLALDPALITDDSEATKTALAAFIGGRVVGIGADGYVALADGAAAGTVKPIGFLLVDAAGAFFENIPAMASGKVGATLGDCVVETDQYSGTITAGDVVYVGTTGDVGLLTTTVATGATQFGIALTDGAANGTVQIARTS